MSSIIILARSCLSAVFAIAGLAKLSDRRGTADTLEAFGVSRPLAWPAAVALPAAELIIAGALLVQPTARWAGSGAALLLIVFGAGVGRALSQGRTPECNCFGQVSSQQISWRTLARNAALAAVAVLVAAAGPGSSLSSWTADRGAANLVAGVAVVIAVICAVAAAGYKQRLVAGDLAGHFGVADGALGPGAEAPTFALQSVDGEEISLHMLLARGLPVVLIFASPTCGPCYDFLPELSRWNGALGDSVTLAVIESGVEHADDVSDQILRAEGVITLIEQNQATAQAYFVAGTPTGIAISPEGLVASPPLPGRQHIENLIRNVLRTGGALPRPVTAPRVPTRT